MPEIFASQAVRHLDGRHLGIQFLSTGASGGTRGMFELATGPDAYRQETTTADTTAINIKATGTAWLQGTSAASSAVYTIDPPIPGVRKTIVCTTANGPVYLKTVNGETIITTLGSTFNTVKASSLGGVFELQGVTTAVWAGLGLTSGTSSQASGFGMTTST